MYLLSATLAPHIRQRINFSFSCVSTFADTFWSWSSGGLTIMDLLSLLLRFDQLASSYWLSFTSLVPAISSFLSSPFSLRFGADRSRFCRLEATATSNNITQTSLSMRFIIARLCTNSRPITRCYELQLDQHMEYRRAAYTESNFYVIWLYYSFDLTGKSFTGHLVHPKEDKSTNTYP